MPTLETYQDVYLWNYVPNLPAAVAFAALFGVLIAAHGWKMVSTKSWFCLAFVAGGICEIIGYAARAAAYDHTGSLVLYLIQAIFLVIPPVGFAASIYMVYARIVTAVDGISFSPISPRWATTIFVLGDFSCLNIQSGGSGLLSHPNVEKIGDYIVVAGLILQVLMFVSFVACCLIFNSRFRKHIAETGAATDIRWQSCLNMLYGTSLAILVRNVYRVVEFIMGQHGYLVEKEWPLYAFDGALMLIVMAGFFIWYPSSLLRPRTQDSMMELRSCDSSGPPEGQTNAAKRSEPSLQSQD